MEESGTEVREKRIKLCYVFVPPSYKECTHCVPKTHTNKKLKQKLTLFLADRQGSEGHLNPTWEWDDSGLVLSLCEVRSSSNLFLEHSLAPCRHWVFKAFALVVVRGEPLSLCSLQGAQTHQCGLSLGPAISQGFVILDVYAFFRAFLPSSSTIISFPVLLNFISKTSISTAWCC